MNLMKYIVMIILIFSVSLTYTQDRFLGISVGGALYSGDLNPINSSDNLKNIGAAFGFSYKQEIGDRFAFRLMLSRNSVEAADSINVFNVASLSTPPSPEDILLINTITRNLSFRNTITEFTLLGEVKVLKFNRFSLSLMGGPAVFRHNPKAIDPETQSFVTPEIVDLQPLRTEGQAFDDQYSLFQFAVPLGIGLNVEVTDKISVGIEFFRRISFTDYIDDASSASYTLIDDIQRISGDVGARLADPSPFSPLVRTGFVIPRPSEDPTTTQIQRANPDNKDYYMSGTFSVWYKLPSTRGKGSYGCPLPY